MRYETKDITTVKAPGFIAHGVNCRRAMGFGVAKALLDKWPDVRTQYISHGSMVLGEAQFIEVGQNLIVANCFTQSNYGYDGRKYADLKAVRDSLGKSALFARKLGIAEIHIPRIGCGFGGLDWDREVEPTLLGLERHYPVTFVVCDL
jgi:O-acetyl-ADP-ribose deacetylase (regulator of RNase III)